MYKLHFDIRDIFRVVRLGWSGKKIWVGLCGTLIAYAGYSILAIVDHLLAGAALREIWHKYGLFPGTAPFPATLAGTAIDVAAMLYVWIVVLLMVCAICKITYQQLKGDDFYSSGDAWRFIIQNWGGVVWGPVATLALFIFFIVAGIVIGWLAGMIPWAGELAFGILFIPIFFAALVAVFISIAFVVSVTMAPAVVGTVGEDALEVAIQSFFVGLEPALAVGTLYGLDEDFRLNRGHLAGNLHGLRNGPGQLGLRPVHEGETGQSGVRRGSVCSL